MVGRVEEVVDGTVISGERDQQLIRSRNCNSSSTSPLQLIAEDGLHVWHMMDIRFLVPKVRLIFAVLMFLLVYRILSYRFPITSTNMNQSSTINNLAKLIPLYSSRLIIKQYVAFQLLKHIT